MSNGYTRNGQLIRLGWVGTIFVVGIQNFWTIDVVWQCSWGDWWVVGGVGAGRTRDENKLGSKGSNLAICAFIWSGWCQYQPRHIRSINSAPVLVHTGQPEPPIPRQARNVMFSHSSSLLFLWIGHHGMIGLIVPRWELLVMMVGWRWMWMWKGPRKEIIKIIKIKCWEICCRVWSWLCCNWSWIA